MSDQGDRAARRSSGGRSKTELARLLGALAIGGLLAAFALLNTGQVEVNWILGTFETPLIIVILVCLAAGIVAGLAGARTRGRAKRGTKSR